MPDYNAIQSPRLEVWVKRLLGIRNGGIVPTVAPELGVGVQLPMYADTDVLAGYWPWGAAGSVAAVAGQNSWVGLLNAAGSGVVQILQFNAATTAAARARLAVGPGLAGGLWAATDYMWRDTRRSFLAPPTVTNPMTGTAALADPPAGHWRIATKALAADTDETFPPIILTPGNGVVLYLNVANLTLYWGLTAWQRSLDPDELLVT